MRTYTFTRTKSPVRGMDVRVTVYRIKRNQPHLVGYSDSILAAWYGSKMEAQLIISDRDKILRTTRRRSGSMGQLRGLLGYAEMYDDHGHDRNAVRLFECSGALQ